MSEREPITAELRRVMNHTTMAGVPLVEIGEYEFGHRCDEIDAVHAALERENVELRERLAVLDESADSMHEGLARLPLDAHGETIHVGDVMEERSGHTFEVASLMAFGGSDNWLVLSDPRNFASFREPHDIRHHHAPTVEDVLRELLDEAEHFHSLEEERDAIAEFAEKLRLAGGDAE